MGLLVTLSGLDGSGKSTLAHLLVNALVTKNAKVQQMECGPLRSWTLLQLLEKEGGVNVRELMSADRIGTALNLERLAFVLDHVVPAVCHCDVVILQRYILDWAAVGRAFGAGAHEAALLKGISTLVNVPTKMFYLQVPPLVASQRIEQRGRSNELRETLPYLEQVASAYQSILEDLALPATILDGQKSVQDLIQEIVPLIMLEVENRHSLKNQH